MNKTLLGLVVCFIIMAVVFAADIAVQYLRIKRKFKKEHVRIAIMQRIYSNQDAANKLFENKSLVNYPVLKEYLKINSLMTVKLENGVALEDFPVQRKKTTEKTSKERKLSEGMFRELASVHKTDEEVFSIVSETADILESVYQFQHPIKFQVYHVKTEVTVKFLLGVLKLFVELNRITASRKTKIQKEMDYAEKSDMLSYSFN